MFLLMLMMLISCRSAVSSDLSDNRVVTKDPIDEAIKILDLRIEDEESKERYYSEPHEMNDENKEKVRRALEQMESPIYKTRKSAEIELTRILHHPQHFAWASEQARSSHTRNQLRVIYERTKKPDPFPPCTTPDDPLTAHSTVPYTMFTMLAEPLEYTAATCSQSLKAYRQQLQLIRDHYDRISPFISWLSKRTKSSWHRAISITSHETCCTLPSSGEKQFQPKILIGYQSDVILDNLEIARLCAELDKGEIFPTSRLKDLPLQILFKKDPETGVTIVPRCTWHDAKSWVLYNPDQDWR